MVCRDLCRLARKYEVRNDGRERSLRVCQFSCEEIALLKQSTNGGFYFFIFISVSCSTCNSHHHATHFISNAKERKDKPSTFTFMLLTGLQSKPIARRPRPSRRSRALKHSLSEGSLTLELLPSPFVLVICPPPRSNSLVHLPKITHSNHNGHLSHPHLRPRPRRQTHRPSDGNSNGLLRSDSAHSLPHGLTQCFGRWVPYGWACR
jgi:hypothetical protein